MRHYTTLELKEDFRGNYNCVIGVNKRGSLNALVGRELESLHLEDCKILVRYDGLNEKEVRDIRELAQKFCKKRENLVDVVDSLNMYLLIDPENGVAKYRED